MPKKKKFKEIKKDEKHEELDDENELEKESGDHEEESELEEGLLDEGLNEGSQNFQFQFDTAKLQDLISNESKAPVLEQVAIASEFRPRRRFSTEEDDEEIKRSSGSKYIPEANASEEQRYMGTNASMDVSIQKSDFSEFGRKKFESNFEVSRERFSESHQLGLQSFSREKYETPERLDIDKAGRDNASDREKKKYEFKASGR
ncbi:MAG: hypothetical protein AABW50_02795 [Nanoarchaeota archaeon]